MSSDPFKEVFKTIAICSIAVKHLVLHIIDAFLFKVLSLLIRILKILEGRYSQLLVYSRHPFYLVSSEIANSPFFLKIQITNIYKLSGNFSV